MRRRYEKGQTLVLLLVFVLVAIAITTAAIFMIANNSTAAGNVNMGRITRQYAESGAEKAILALLRNPDYTGESFTLDGSTVTASVSGTTTLTIISTAVNGNFTKKVEVIATNSDNVINITSWKETD